VLGTNCTLPVFVTVDCTFMTQLQWFIFITIRLKDIKNH